MSERIPDLLYKTVSDIELWRDVLFELVNEACAEKGIIMLRDKATAELYITENIQVDLGSPMVLGFTAEQTDSYINYYYQFDPWTEIERKNHPVFPYAMSSLLTIEDLKKTKLWDWLEPQGINDCAVVDIYSSTSNWVSINLYFDGTVETVKRRVVATLKKYQKMMMEFWRLGQQFRASKSSPEGMNYFLMQHQSPAALIDADLNVVSINPLLATLLQGRHNQVSMKGGCLYIHNRQGRLELSQAVKHLGRRYKCADSPISVDLTIGNLHFSATLLGSGEDMIGNDSSLRLLLITPVAQQLQMDSRPIWETPGLTKREKQLAEVLAQGGRVVDFMNQYRLAKSTAHAQWGSLKSKLGVKDRSEIYAKHQLYLQNQ